MSPIYVVLWTSTSPSLYSTRLVLELKAHIQPDSGTEAHSNLLHLKWQPTRNKTMTHLISEFSPDSFRKLVLSTDDSEGLTLRTTIKMCASHRASGAHCVHLYVYESANVCVSVFVPLYFLLTFHSRLHQGWAWGLSWRCTPLWGCLPAGWCPSGTPEYPSSPSWHSSHQGAPWQSGRSMDDFLEGENTAQIQRERN